MIFDMTSLIMVAVCGGVFLTIIGITFYFIDSIDKKSSKNEKREKLKDHIKDMEIYEQMKKERLERERI